MEEGCGAKYGSELAGDEGKGAAAWRVGGGIAEWLAFKLVHELAEMGEFGEAVALEFEDDAEGAAEIFEEGVGARVIGDDALWDGAFLLYLIDVLTKDVAVVIV